MVTQFKRWLESVLDRRPSAAERLLDLEREAQSLRLELTEREKILAHLETTLERQRNSEDRRVNEAVQLQIERLLSDVAAPLTQLLAQAHLLEVAGKPLQARDVMAVAKRLIRVLEQHGLQLTAAVGATVSYDPDQHEPLSADVTLNPEQPAVVRFMGVSYRGKTLRKARVEPGFNAP